jgi:hypothetical protein
MGKKKKIVLPVGEKTLQQFVFVFVFIPITNSRDLPITGIIGREKEIKILLKYLT